MEEEVKTLYRPVIVLGAILLVFWASTMGWEMTSIEMNPLAYVPQTISFPGILFLFQVYEHPWFDHIMRISPFFYGLLFAVVFVIWSKDMWRGQVAQPSRRTLVIVGVIIFLSAVLHVSFYVTGSYRFMDGYAFLVTSFWLGVTLIVAYLFYRSMNLRTVANIVGSRLVFLIWLSWLAFPYIGELP